MTEKVVYKYQIETVKFQELKLPVGAQILTVMMQYEMETPTLWALVNPLQNIMKVRKIQLVRSGYDLVSEHSKYITSFQKNGGEFTFHVFEML